ncbi:MAG: choice-of-anchor V domain-containing protein [bacterium]
MSLSPGVHRAGPWVVLGLFAVAATLFVAPTGLGHSSGMFKDTGDYPGDFAAKGCTHCHGDNKFAAGGADKLQVSITDAGQPLVGNAYEKGKTYTINVTLVDEQFSDKDNHAGFNLRATAGKLLVGSDPNVQVSTDQSQATHKAASATRWSVNWAAPDAGPVVFDIFVNDVNGDLGNDPGDKVYRADPSLAGPEGAVAGAPAEVKEVQFGISLQQYWIGLIGLAGMIFVMVAGYVYLKYVTPHNTDQKDR